MTRLWNGSQKICSRVLNDAYHIIFGLQTNRLRINVSRLFGITCPQHGTILDIQTLIKVCNTEANERRSWNEIKLDSSRTNHGNSYNICAQNYIILQFQFYKLFMLTNILINCLCQYFINRSFHTLLSSSTKLYDGRITTSKYTTMKAMRYSANKFAESLFTRILGPFDWIS